MIRLSNATLVAIAAACLSSTPLAAQDRAIVTTHIATADLNLASAAGIARLRQRLHHAASIACAPVRDTLADRSDAARCQAEMEQDGRVKLASLMQRSDIELATR